MVLVSGVTGTVPGRLKSLQRLVASFRQSAGNLSYELIIVACACSEETHKWIRQQEDCVLVIRPKKEGSVIAFNDGFARARGRFVVTLNDDVKVDGDTIQIAAEHLLENPEVGQVAFGHRYQNRQGDRTAPRIQRMFGYPYAQCGMTRKWLGDLAGWWGDVGLIHYGGDNWLSACIWEMGWRVEAVKGCSVTDWEVEDETRQQFSHHMRAANGGVHPDVELFMKHWRGRLPPPQKWRSANVNRVIVKANQGNLRTLQFKSTMGPGYPRRTTVIDEFRAYGPAKQANHTWKVSQVGRESAQQWFIEVAKRFQADLIMLQGQRPNNITPSTAMRLRKEVPNAYVFNWDADTHYPMLDFHAEIAKAVDLQLTISPTLFPWYISHGASNIGYWPIGVQEEYLNVERSRYLREKQSHDVAFYGSLYGEEHFPEALTRRDAVLTLARSDLDLELRGLGWNKVSLQAENTLEAFVDNAIGYSRSKMALSISQTKDLWGYTSDRAYNIMATGCPILVQRFAGMEEHGFVDGETVIAWTTFKEMMDKARYYIAHPQKREDIGRAGRQLIHARHTWKQRIYELWGLISGIGGERA